MFTRSRLLIVLTAIFLLGIVSCSKDHDTVVTPAPIGNGNDTMTVGDVLALQPVISAERPLSYQWTLEDKVIGTDSVLQFTPTVRGDYAINLKVTNTGGAFFYVYHIHAYGKYENGFFIANEGWFGHGTGTISFYRYDTRQMEDSVFVKANPEKDLMPATSTVEFTTIWNGKCYILSKVGGPIVQTDAYSLKEINRVAATGGNDWRAFLGIDSTHALVSSSKGIYTLDLGSMAVGSLLSSVSGEVDDMIQSGNYIYVLSSSKDIVILNSSDYSIVKNYTGFSVAFAKTPDGAVWAAGGKTLVRIDPTSLDTTQVSLPLAAASSTGAWHAGSITASTTENTVFVAGGSSSWAPNQIYKYTTGDNNTVTAPFISIPSGKMLYGKGLAFDPVKKRLVVTIVTSNYFTNDLSFYDPSTGYLAKNSSYSGYYFPAMPVF
ncbi:MULTISPECIES: DUF5074 domain-containing protein [Chitinophagaceae]